MNHSVDSSNFKRDIQTLHQPEIHRRCTLVRWVHHTARHGQEGRVQGQITHHFTDRHRQTQNHKRPETIGQEKTQGSRLHQTRRTNRDEKTGTNRPTNGNKVDVSLFKRSVGVMELLLLLVGGLAQRHLRGAVVVVVLICLQVSLCGSTLELFLSVSRHDELGKNQNKK